MISFFAGAIGHIAMVLLHLSILAIDVMLLFLLMRFLHHKWPGVAWIGRFDAVGARLVDPLTAVAMRRGAVSYEGSFFWISLALCGARLVLLGFGNALLTCP